MDLFKLYPLNGFRTASAGLWSSKIVYFFLSTDLFCAAFLVACWQAYYCEFGENYGEEVKIFPEHEQVRLRAGHLHGSTYFIAPLFVTFKISRLSISHHGRRRKKIWLK